MNQFWTSKYSGYLENILLIVLFLRIAFLTWQSLPFFQNKFDYFRVSVIYNHSQYNLDNAEFFGNIEDDLLYQLAGYEYITGTDPSSINSEVPFLGKYLYGVSIYFFGSALVVQFLIGMGILYLVYLCSRLLGLSNLISFLVVLGLTFDQLFLAQLQTSLLDLHHAFWILLTVYFASLYLVKKKHQPGQLIWVGIALGAVATTKLWITGALIWLVIGSLIWSKSKNLKSVFHPLVSISFTSVAFYLLTHIVFFIYNKNPLDFVGLHLDTIRLYRGYLPEYPWGEMLRIMLVGQWQTWWGDQGIINVAEWNIFWPIGLFASLCVFVRGFAKKQLPLILISSVIILYVASNLIHVVFPRYVLSILPLMYILIGICLGESYKKQATRNPTSPRLREASKKQVTPAPNGIHSIEGGNAGEVCS